MREATILLLDYDPAGGLGGALAHILAATPGVAVQTQAAELSGAATPLKQDLLELIKGCRPQVVILIFPRQLGKLSRTLLRLCKRTDATLPLIIVTEGWGPDEIFAALELGVADFITPPLKALDILPRVWRLTKGVGQGEATAQTLKETIGLRQLIGESQIFRDAVRKIPLMARCDAGVLISGETGTGKELCARAIHYLSPLAHHPFIPVNWGALPINGSDRIKQR